MNHDWKVKLHSDELCKDDYVIVEGCSNKHTAMLCGEEDYSRPTFHAIDAFAIPNSEVKH